MTKMIRMTHFPSEHEIGLIGSILNDISILANVKSQPEHLENDWLRLVYELIEEQANQGMTPDSASLASTRKIALTDLLDTVMKLPTSANWSYYDKEVMQSYQLRELKKAHAELNACIQRGDVDGAKDLIGNMFRGEESHTEHNALQGASLALEHYTSPTVRYEIKGEPTLTDHIGGLEPTKLYTIGARPSVGKSAFAGQLAFKLSEQYPVHMYQMEMMVSELLEREVCRRNRVSHTQVRTRQLHPTDMANYLGEIADLDITFNDRGRWTLGKLVLDIRNQVKFKGRKIIFIDQITHISSGAKDRHMQIGEITSTLKSLAKELNIAVVLVSQINRDFEGKMPTLAGLKAGGGLEEDSDVVILLHRDIQDMLNNEKTSVIIAKARGARTGEIPYLFQGQYMAFTEITDQYE